MSDYIKLYRSLLKWEWYSNTNTTRVFLHMLLKANWKDGKFEGEVIPRGSFVSSFEKLAKETNLSVMQIRTAVKHLKLTKEITSKSYSKYTVFTVLNYDLFQTDNKQDNKQVTSEQQTDNKQITTIEERKEIKKERNKNIYTCAFEEFWTAYPRKKDKGNAFKKFNARLVEGFSEVELIGAAKEYAKECEENRVADKYIKHPSTFLSNTKPFLDYLEKPKPNAETEPQEEDEELVGDDW